MSVSRFLITAAFVVFIGGPFVIERFGGWLEGQQQDVIDKSIAADQAREAKIESELASRREAKLGQFCTEIFESTGCTKPTSFQSLAGCLQRLSVNGCDDLAGVNLCGAVEEITVCRVPRNDAVRRGCKSLRQAADCARRPAPEKPTHNWTIAVPS